MTDTTEADIVLEDDDPTKIRDNPDGSADVVIDEGESDDATREHFANLAEDRKFGDILGALARDLDDAVERDKKAREKRDKQYEEGLRRTGLGDDAPGGAAFSGASRVVHPMLIEAAIDFSARVTRELLPAAGPVKEKILGTPTQAKLDKANRVARYMNWQLTEQIENYYHETEQCMTQAPLGGAGYMKPWYNPKLKKPECCFVPIDYVHRPYADCDFYDCERITHEQHISRSVMERRMREGIYRKLDLTTPPDPEPTKSEQANDKIEGREATGDSEDIPFTVYETSWLVAVEDEDEPMPYLVTMDHGTRQILAIYRNWMPDDDKRTRLDFLIEFPFWPWRGGYPIGMTHMIAGLSAAATGALRALLDSAHMANFPTTLKLKGGATVGGQNVRPNVGEVTEIEGSLTQDDVRKTFMQLTFPGPSPTLFQLLGFLVDAAKGVVRTTFDDLVNANNPQLPVGTAMALIEQGLTNFSSIHARLHRAQKRFLKNLYRMNGVTVEEKEVIDDFGEVVVTRQDFRAPCDIIPVSDPNIFSDVQRLSRAQAIVSRAALLPQVYDIRKVEAFFLKQMKVDDPDEFLVKPSTPEEQNAVNENVTATLGRPILAFPDQDHLMHLQVHLDFMTSPDLGGSQLIAPQFLPVMLGHIKEHIALWYVSRAAKMVEDTTGEDITPFMKEKDVKPKLDKLLAAASPDLIGEAKRVFAKLPPIIAQAMQTMQQLAPPPPVDPTQAAMAQVKQRAESDAQKAAIEKDKSDKQAALKQAELQQRKGTEDQRIMIDQANLERQQAADQADGALREQEINVRHQMNVEDNTTALDLAQMEVESGEKFAVSTGTGVNPGNG